MAATVEGGGGGAWGYAKTLCLDRGYMLFTSHTACFLLV